MIILIIAVRYEPWITLLSKPLYSRFEPHREFSVGYAIHFNLKGK